MDKRLIEASRICGKGPLSFALGVPDFDDPADIGTLSTTQSQTLDVILEAHQRLNSLHTGNMWTSGDRINVTKAFLWSPYLMGLEGHKDGVSPLHYLNEINKGKIVASPSKIFELIDESFDLKPL